MAGRGGLNLTHSEPLDPFLARYGDAPDALRAAIAAFPPDALRAWSEALGQPTFVGSSGRVFPRAMKASPLLRAWLRRLDAARRARSRCGITGSDGTMRDALAFEAPDGAVAIEAGRDRAGARRRELAAARLGRRMGRRLDAGRRRDRAAAAVQLRLPGRLVGHCFATFRRTAAEALRAVVRRSCGARRGDHHGGGTGGRRDLCAVRRRCATRSPHMARPCCASRCVPT